MASATTPSLLSGLRTPRRLPSSISVAIRVLELCRREECRLHELVDVIASDPALAGRLLKYANSPAVGAQREVTTVRDAVLIMGLRAVKLTALGFSLASSSSKPRCRAFDLKRFRTESFITAVTARRLAGGYFNIDQEEAFAAGLLARVGQLALAQALPEQYAEILQSAGPGCPLEALEREKLGIDHVQFGARLLADWQLPEILVHAVEYHLHPERAPKGVKCLAGVIHAAKQLAPLFANHAEQEVCAEALESARQAIKSTLKLSAHSCKCLADEIRSEYLQVADIFEIEHHGEVSALDLYAEAQEEATRVGIVAELEQNRTLEMNRQLLHRATTDVLTGIANRAKFDDRLAEAIKGLRRGHGDFLLLFFDIDHFKKFNDTYGHDVGDLLLKRVARAAQNSVRDVDLVARYGGEEFVVLAPHTDRKGACIIAARVCRCIEQLHIDVSGTPLSVTVSVGLAMTADYPEPPTPEQLLADADKQLYLSKKGGRNTWSYLGRTAPRCTPVAQ